MPQVQDTKTYCEGKRKNKQLRVSTLCIVLFRPSNETFFPALPCRHKIHGTGIEILLYLHMYVCMKIAGGTKYSSIKGIVLVGMEGALHFLLVFPSALITHFINFVSLFIAVGNYGYSYARLSARYSEFHFFSKLFFLILQNCMLHLKKVCHAWSVYLFRKILQYSDKYLLESRQQFVATYAAAGLVIFNASLTQLKNIIANFGLARAFVFWPTKSLNQLMLHETQKLEAKIRNQTLKMKPSAETRLSGCL